MYQQYHTRRHRHSTHSHQHIIGSSSMHSFPPAIVSPVLLCQKLPSPIRVQERSRIGLRITTVYAYSVYDYGRLRGVLGVCVLRLRSGTVFPSCANIVLRPFIHILRYAYRLSFLRTYPGSLLATNQFLQPSPIQLKSPPSFYLILHVYCTFLTLSLNSFATFYYFPRFLTELIIIQRQIYYHPNYDTRNRLLVISPTSPQVVG